MLLPHRSRERVMGSVELDQSTDERLQILAQAWRVSKADAVSRVFSEWMAIGSKPSAGPQPEHRRHEVAPGTTSDGHVDVYLEYEGVRSQGLFDPSTEALRITEGPLAGKFYKSPTGAAVAVVQHVNPSVNPNRNGWSTWRVTESGEFLQSIRGRGE